MVNSIIPVMLDAGVKNIDSFKFFLDYAFKIIVPTETLEDLDYLYKIFEDYPKQRIVISVDVKDNELYSKNLDLTLSEYKEVLEEIDPSEIILLDISSVGTEKGYNKKLLEEFEDMKDKLIIAGGLNKDSISELENIGIKKVLVGTGLHSGEITIIQINAFNATYGKAQATINNTKPKPNLGLFSSSTPEIINNNPKNPKITGKI